MGIEDYDRGCREIVNCARQVTDEYATARNVVGGCRTTVWQARHNVVLAPDLNPMPREEKQ